MPALIASKPKGSPISGHAYEMFRPIASTTGARHLVDLTRLRHDSTKSNDRTRLDFLDVGSAVVPICRVSDSERRVATSRHRHRERRSPKQPEARDTGASAFDFDTRPSLGAALVLVQSSDGWSPPYSLTVPEGPVHFGHGSGGREALGSRVSLRRGGLRSDRIANLHQVE